MPEYLAPGAYIEEANLRTRSIEGVSTSTAGFVGPARFGPVDGEPVHVTRLADFERVFGGLDPLSFRDEDAGAAIEGRNDLAQGARVFFEEGGQSLWIARIFKPLTEARVDATQDGRARASVAGIDQDGQGTSPEIELTARYPGSGGNLRVTFTARLSQSRLAAVPRDPGRPDGPQDLVLRGVAPFDLVWLRGAGVGRGALYWVERSFNAASSHPSWRFHPAADDSAPLELSALDPAATDSVRILTLGVEVEHPGRFARVETWEGIAFHPDHPRSLHAIFAETFAQRAQALSAPIIVTSAAANGAQIAQTLLGQPRRIDRERILRLIGAVDEHGNPVDDDGSGQPVDLSVLALLDQEALADADRRFTLRLRGGNDGQRPDAAAYAGDADPGARSGLSALETIADVSIVAVPGATFGCSDPAYRPDADRIIRHVISHCERMRYRVAVLDSGDGMGLAEVRALRGQLDSTHAALYFPWVTIIDPLSGMPVSLPPSGFLAGIWARNDLETGVHRAPANQVIRLATNLELRLSDAQQDVLNPLGINCLRFFEGHRFLVWGARTISSDPELKYVNVRRYLAYLERSIERGLAWVVFEGHSERLWDEVRRRVIAFLLNELRSERLLGRAPEEAFFVRCDRSTMTQSDIDAGRLICLIGVALLRPSEFVDLRIGKRTADALG